MGTKRYSTSAANKPAIYCRYCENFKTCKYVEDIRKQYDDPADVRPVIYGECLDYIPKKR